MSRREEVEASIKWIMSAGISGGAITPNMRDLARTLADEVDQRDAVITKLLELVKPEGECPPLTVRFDPGVTVWRCREELHRLASLIAGREE